MPPTLQPQNAEKTLPQMYEQLVAAEKLRGDDAQRTIVEKLEQLRLKLAIPAATPGAIDKLMARVFGEKPDENKPKSIYIWGDVGRGKSLLMDMFFASAPVASKKRIHFHAFMAEVHAAAHVMRQEHTELENPVAHVAVQMAKEHKLLCLDELQVTDVADAMILSKLFHTQLDEGVTFVLTSNRPPEELYKGGLQREKFIPFVRLLERRMDVLNLDSLHDYRMQQIRAMEKVYYYPRNEEADKKLRDTYRHLTNDVPRPPTVLQVQGRKLEINESYGMTAMFTFHELCEKAVGPSDYLAIAQHFSVVLISGIPRLNSDKRNEARRFVTLIDTLYDHKVKLICTADAPPEELYEQGDGHFEFQRTVSRLAEMQSEGYLAAHHIP